ncbi:MAG: GLUG motif-containing protein [Dehalobacterium sp.]
MYKRRIKTKRFIKGLLYNVFFLCILISLILYSEITARAVSSEWTGNIATGFAGGTGTEADPYLISTGEQLAYFSQQVNNGTNYTSQYIKLTQDILLNNMNADGTFVKPEKNRKEFTPIGKENGAFRGTFDGNGYKIIGIYIDKNYINYQALFGYAGTGSVIWDVGISGSIAGGNYAGSIAAYTNGIITGCITDCAVTINYRNYHGGIAGFAGFDSVISNCVVSGTIEGSECVGGVVGYTEGEIIDCTDINPAVSGYKRVGGIAGYAAGIDSVISNCSFSGTVAGTGNYYVGGIAGQIEGVITECSVNATLTANNSYIGGVAGYSAGVGSKIRDCTVSVTITEIGGGGYAGGVAGQTEGEITGCTVSVSVSAPNSYIGGVAGYSAGAGSIINGCTVSGTVTATAGEGYVGGVAGKTDGVITGCSNESTVTGVHHYVGGIVGYASSGSEISSSSSYGDVSGNSEVGGVAGYTNGVIKICINTGDVTGNNGHTGGIAGMTGNNSTVSNSYNSGAIDGGTGQGGIGGIIGYANPDTILHNNLNKGTVDGNQFVGCIVGNSINEDNAWNNYYYDYENAPEGTNSGDIEDDDAAVPVGDMTWEEIRDLLNLNNEDGDVWTQDMDDDGIPKPGVFVPGPDVEILNSKIKEGKYYTTTALLGAGTSVTITSESVFTVLLSLRYNISCDPEAQTLRLTSNDGEVQLPVATSIIMLIDDSYYYINLGTEASSIVLGEFMKMGSTEEHYDPATAEAEEEQEYLFIFDFSKTAMAGQIATASYNIELLAGNGDYGGTMPVVTATGKNTYTLTVNGGTDMLTVSLSKVSAPGYDYKTDGKMYSYVFYLKKDGVAVSFPAGIKINGNVIASSLPYIFASAAFEENTFISIDMSNCAAPLTAGGYSFQIKVFTCKDILNPCNGYILESGTADVALTAPVTYAIKANSGIRVFDNSLSDIPVEFTIQTLGSNSIKYTLQRKYGTTYVNMEGQVNQPVTITGERAIFTIPAGCPKGTYRFVFALYDSNNIKKSQTAQSIIIR